MLDFIDSFNLSTTDDICMINTALNPTYSTVKGLHRVSTQAREKSKRIKRYMMELGAREQLRNCGAVR